MQHEAIPHPFEFVADDNPPDATTPASTLVDEITPSLASEHRLHGEIGYHLRKDTHRG